jgi:hypothetical protein
MTKSELRDKIKTSVKKIWSSKQKSVDLDMPSSGDLSLDDNTLPILVKFPELKQVLIDLLTKNYNLFVEDVAWIAPRPTTFQIELKNNQLFYITHTDRSWIAQVEGKKYYLLNLDEEERAAEAIAPVKKSFSYLKEYRVLEFFIILIVFIVGSLIALCPTYQRKCFYF